MSDQKHVSTSAVAHALERAPTAILLVTCDGVVECASDAAAHLVDLEHGTDILGTDVSLFTPGELARHRLKDVADGTVEAAFAHMGITTSTGTHATVSAWWRRLLTDGGLRVLVTLTPQELTPPPGAAQQAPGWLALVTTDHDWRVVDVSNDTTELLTPQGLVGHGLLGFVHPLDLNEVVEALALLSEAVHAITVRARVHRAKDWVLFDVTFARLCPHRPPRLVCLLSPAADAGGPELELESLLRERDTGQLLAHVGRALDRLATTHDLTAQELEIIARSMRGESSRKIAQGMYLSEGTVRNALSTLYRKFQVHSQLELVTAVLHTT